VETDALVARLAAGLVRVAVTTQDDTTRDNGADPPRIERTIAQQQMLLTLGRRAQEYRLSDLAADLDMTVPVTVATSGALAREGLIQMRPCPSYAPDDVRVGLTAAGRAAIPRLSNWAGALLGEIAHLDEQTQREVLRHVAEQITRLQREGRIPVTRICVTCRYFEGYADPGAAAPHHCWYLDVPFGYRQLRLRCPDQSA
jgi:DNA-binding MarR family transcriptional regulator